MLLTKYMVVVVLRWATEDARQKIVGKKLKARIAAVRLDKQKRNEQIVCNPAQRMLRQPEENGEALHEHVREHLERPVNKTVLDGLNREEGGLVWSTLVVPDVKPSNKLGGVPRVEGLVNETENKIVENHAWDKFC